MTIQKNLDAAEYEAVTEALLDTEKVSVMAADEWFAQGRRVPYDPVTKKVLTFAKGI